MLKGVIAILVGLLIALALLVLAAGRGWFGNHEEPGEVTERALARALAGGRVVEQKPAGPGHASSKSVRPGPASPVRPRRR